MPKLTMKTVEGLAARTGVKIVRLTGTKGPRGYYVYNEDGEAVAKEDGTLIHYGAEEIYDTITTRL